MCLLVAAARPVGAQELYGSVVGIVRDAQAGILPGATVTLVNRDTGFRREAITNAEGAFTFTNVQNGPYDVRVRMPSFREAVQTNVPVAVGQISRVQIALEIGGMAETVEVVAPIRFLQTDKADVRTELKSEEITALPLNQYRNYQALINLVPGSLPGGMPNSETLLPQRSINYSVNGQGAGAAATRTDGTNLQNAFLPNHQMYIPPAETIESVNIVTGSMDAENGGTSGASVSVTSKSGTNKFKGSAFEFFNNEKLNATPFFIGTGTPPAKLPIERQTRGATTGGPLMRNRIFFFASYELYSSRREQATFYSVPDAKMRGGDFSSAINTNGTLQLIFDPTTGTSGIGRTQFAGNVISANRISEVAKRVLNYYPLPNVAGTGAGGFTRNYVQNQKSTTSRPNYDLKINWNAAAAQQIWIKISHMDSLVNDQHVFGVPYSSTAGGHVTFWQGTVGDTWAPTRTLTIDGTLGVADMYTEAKTADYFEGMIGLTVLGIPGTNDQGTGEERYSGLPQFSTGFQAVGNAVGFIPNTRADRTTAGSVNVTKFMGAHEFKGGYTLNYMTLDHWNPEGANPRGAFSFNGNATRTLGTGTQTANFYNQFSQFLLGLTNSISKSVQYRQFTVGEWQHAAYLRDRWNVGPKLTLDLGVRWEYYPVMGRMDLGKGIERLDLNTLEVLLGGVGGNPKDVGFHAAKGNFAPRVGLVYRIEDNGVLRAGYGLAFDARPWAEDFNGRSQFPLAINSTFQTAATEANFGWYGTLEQGIPLVVGPNLSTGRVPLPNTVGMTTLGTAADQRPVTHSWNVAYQRRLPIVTVDLAYVGNKSLNTYSNINVNTVQHLGGGAADRPYQIKFGRSLAINVRTPYGERTYNSLQIGVNRPMAKGLLLKGQYTFSRARSLGTSYELPEFKDRNWTRQGGNRDHNLQIAVVYQVPWQANTTRNVLKMLASDWQINGVFGALSGTPFTVTADGTLLNTPGNTMTADLVGELKKIGKIGQDGLFYDPASFAPPTCSLCLGNTRLNQFTGPGGFNLDMSVVRSFPLGGQRRFETRFEATNVTNTPKYGNPTSSITSGDFMRVSGIDGNFSERMVRIALRFSF